MAACHAVFLVIIAVFVPIMGMRLLLVHIIALLLLASCSFSGRDTVTISLGETHYWEYLEDRPMWYTLVWFDGSSIRRRTVGSSSRLVEVSVKRGACCVFAAYPLDSLRPMGGFHSPGSSAPVHLSFDNGRLADLVLEAAEKYPDLVSSLDADSLLALVPPDFDEDALYEDFVDGSLGYSRPASRKTFSISFSSLPEGRYVSEYDDGPCFDMSHGAVFTFELSAGIHRFYNSGKDFVHVVAVYPDGSSSTYNYLLSGW